MKEKKKIKQSNNCETLTNSADFKKKNSHIEKCLTEKD